MTEHGPATVTTATDPTDIDPCPYCTTTSSVQPITGTPPEVAAWSCTTCGMDWVISNPRPYFDRLTATIEQLGVLRQVIALADDAPGLTDQQPRDRLLALVAPMSMVRTER